jgi:hypothetical protein
VKITVCAPQRLHFAPAIEAPDSILSRCCTRKGEILPFVWVKPLPRKRTAKMFHVKHLRCPFAHISHDYVPIDRFLYCLRPTRPRVGKRSASFWLRFNLA